MRCFFFPHQPGTSQHILCAKMGLFYLGKWDRVGIGPPQQCPLPLSIFSMYLSNHTNIIIFNVHHEVKNSWKYHIGSVSVTAKVLGGTNHNEPQSTHRLPYFIYLHPALHKCLPNKMQSNLKYEENMTKGNKGWKDKKEPRVRSVHK